VVVHREPEQNREEEQREPGLDRINLLETEEVGDRFADLGPTLLEDQRDRSVGSADRQQVHEDGLHRQHDRAEDDREGPTA
jgi:hypothetical protein